MTSPFQVQDAMEWQKKKQQEDQVLQAARQNATNIPLVDQAIDPNATYNKTADTVAQMGQQATAGVIGAVQKQKQDAQALQQQQFIEQQQKAQARLQEQQQQYYNQMQQQYANQFNSQAAEQTKAWNEYYRQLEGYNQQITAQGQGTPTQITGQQYTGQAAQIAQYARQVGFPESQIPTAVAIAMAESSGRANAVNNANSNGSSDYGLMQINSIHSNLLSQYDWKDPLQNMQMAYQIWKDAGGKWTPWSTYNNGAYQQFTGVGTTAANAIQPANIQPFMTQTTNGLRQAITADAKQYLGLPYVWGGTDLSKGVDCSGLVQSVYKQFGIQLPRTADEQAHYGVKTSVSNLQPGDLVAWQGGYRGPNYVGHIAIYMGNGQILEAQQTGVPVHIRNLGKNENVFGVHLTNLNRDSNGMPVNVPAPIPRSSSSNVSTGSAIGSVGKSFIPSAPKQPQWTASRPKETSYSW